MEGLGSVAGGFEVCRRVRCVVRGVEGCGRGRGAWWEGWCVEGGVEVSLGGVVGGWGR